MDRFTKVRNIGKGNMGACYLMRSLEDGKLYVIKQIDLSRMSKKERSQSLNEAKVLSSLRHPNVINYVDSFLARKSESLCIVMEFADSGDLGTQVKVAQGLPFAEDQILDWFIQLVLAVLYCHSKHILHRDIKLQNIFLTTSGLCKLGDFGIARVMENTFDQAHTFVGTPYYLSPEVILEKPYGSSSDVWAVGVCLYELMSHKHPFNATDMKSLMQRILRCHYDPLPTQYSRDLREIVQKVLVKDPARRPTLVDILQLPVVQRRLQAWVNGTSGLPTNYVQLLLRYKQIPLTATVAAQADGALPRIESKKEVLRDPEATVPQRVAADAGPSYHQKPYGVSGPIGSTPSPEPPVPMFRSGLPQIHARHQEESVPPESSRMLPPVSRIPVQQHQQPSTHLYEAYGIPQPLVAPMARGYPSNNSNISSYVSPYAQHKVQAKPRIANPYHLPQIGGGGGYHHQPAGVVSQLPPLGRQGGQGGHVLMYVPPRNQR
eukprot:PhF_6_TR6288/c0_g1_i1/m.9523/K08857/NEK1_4_5; NIMA (never in mitosis gene a)-related kinase 1/4/5